jgi:hypothetical protein
MIKKVDCMSSPPRDPASMNYLESLQHGMISALAPDFGQADEASLLDAAQQVINMGLARPGDTPRSVLSQLQRQESGFAEPERWSRYEPPYHRMFLYLAEKYVISGLGAGHEELPAKMPAIGTLPTHQLNAESKAVPDSNTYVVAFETGIFDFTSAWAKIVGACLLSHRSDSLTILFIDLVFSQVIIGSAVYAENNLVALNPEVWKYSHSAIKPVFEAFLLAHEYGHVKLGHQQDRLETSAVANHERELAADAYGFRLMLRAFKDPAEVYCAVSSLLCGMMLFERGYELLEHEPWTSETHPPAAVRRTRLFQAALELMPRSELDEAISWTKKVEDETFRLWLPLEKPLLKAREVWPKSWIPDNPEHKRAAIGQFLGLIADSQGEP